MNLYDFDNTIFRGDSSVRFIKYSLIHYPFKVLYCFLKALKECIKCLFKKSNFGFVKSELFSFVKDINNLDEYMNNYVVKNMDRIKKFYLEQKEEEDVVISASFDFIVRPFCEKLGIKTIICTEFDTKNGHIIGKNCKGVEKIVRFKEVFKNYNVCNAYSDSLSDIPMFEIAKNGYVVKGDNIIPYKK